MSMSEKFMLFHIHTFYDVIRDRHKEREQGNKSVLREKD